MARKKGRHISPKIEGELLSNVISIMRPNEERKSFLAGRGMLVNKKENLTKACYVCKNTGSLDNQLIPRWISKETMVCVCFGCYERSVGWVKVDNAVKITDFNIGKSFIDLSGSIKEHLAKAEIKPVLNTPKR